MAAVVGLNWTEHVAVPSWWCLPGGGGYCGPALQSISTPTPACFSLLFCRGECAPVGREAWLRRPIASRFGIFSLFRNTPLESFVPAHGMVVGFFQQS